MKQQHQTLLHLVEFTFFPAEVEPHLQSFLQRILKGRSQGWVGIDPEGGDAHSSGCHRNRPVEPMSGSFRASSRSALIGRVELGMPTSIETSSGLGNGLRDFVSIGSQHDAAGS